MGTGTSKENEETPYGVNEARFRRSSSTYSDPIDARELSIMEDSVSFKSTVMNHDSNPDQPTTSTAIEEAPKTQQKSNKKRRLVIKPKTDIFQDFVSFLEKLNKSTTTSRNDFDFKKLASIPDDDLYHAFFLLLTHLYEDFGNLTNVVDIFCWIFKSRQVSKSNFPSAFEKLFQNELLRIAENSDWDEIVMFGALACELHSMYEADTFFITKQLNLWVDNLIESALYGNENALIALMCILLRMIKSSYPSKINFRNRVKIVEILLQDVSVESKKLQLDLFYDLERVLMLGPPEFDEEKYVAEISTSAKCAAFKTFVESPTENALSFDINNFADLTKYEIEFFALTIIDASVSQPKRIKFFAFFLLQYQKLLTFIRGVGKAVGARFEKEFDAIRNGDRSDQDLRYFKNIAEFIGELYVSKNKIIAPIYLKSWLSTVLNLNKSNKFNVEILAETLKLCGFLYKFDDRKNFDKIIDSLTLLSAQDPNIDITNTLMEIQEDIDESQFNEIYEQRLYKTNQDAVMVTDLQEVVLRISRGENVKFNYESAINFSSYTHGNDLAQVFLEKVTEIDSNPIKLAKFLKSYYNFSYIAGAFVKRIKANLESRISSMSIDKVDEIRSLGKLSGELRNFIIVDKIAQKKWLEKMDEFIGDNPANMSIIIVMLDVLKVILLNLQVHDPKTYEKYMEFVRNCNPHRDHKVTIKMDEITENYPEHEIDLVSRNIFHQIRCSYPIQNIPDMPVHDPDAFDMEDFTKTFYLNAISNTYIVKKFINSMTILCGRRSGETFRHCLRKFCDEKIQNFSYAINYADENESAGELRFLAMALEKQLIDEEHMIRLVEVLNNKIDTVIGRSCLECLLKIFNVNLKITDPMNQSKYSYRLRGLVKSSRFELSKRKTQSGVQIVQQQTHRNRYDGNRGIYRSGELQDDRKSRDSKPGTSKAPNPEASNSIKEDTKPGTSKPPNPEASNSIKADTKPGTSKPPNTEAGNSIKADSKPGTSVRPTPEASNSIKDDTKPGTSKPPNPEASNSIKADTKPGTSKPPNTEAGNSIKADTEPGTSRGSLLGDYNPNHTKPNILFSKTHVLVDDKVANEIVQGITENLDAFKGYVYALQVYLQQFPHLASEAVKKVKIIAKSLQKNHNDMLNILCIEMDEYLTNFSKKNGFDLVQNRNDFTLLFAGIRHFVSRQSYYRLLENPLEKIRNGNILALVVLVDLLEVTKDVLAEDCRERDNFIPFCVSILEKAAKFKSDERTKQRVLDILAFLKTQKVKSVNSWRDQEKSGDQKPERSQDSKRSNQNSNSKGQSTGNQQNSNNSSGNSKPSNAFYYRQRKSSQGSLNNQAPEKAQNTHKPNQKSQQNRSETKTQMSAIISELTSTNVADCATKILKFLTCVDADRSFMHILVEKAVSAEKLIRPSIELFNAIFQKFNFKASRLMLIGILNAKFMQLMNSPNSSNHELFNCVEMLLVSEPLMKDSSYFQLLLTALEAIKSNHPQGILVFIKLSEKKIPIFFATKNRKVHLEEVLRVLKSKVNGIGDNRLRERTFEMIWLLESGKNEESKARDGESLKKLGEVGQKSNRGDQNGGDCSQKLGNSSQKAGNSSQNPGSYSQKPKSFQKPQNSSQNATRSRDSSQASQTSSRNSRNNQNSRSLVEAKLLPLLDQLTHLTTETIGPEIIKAVPLNFSERAFFEIIIQKAISDKKLVKPHVKLLEFLARKNLFRVRAIMVTVLYDKLFELMENEATHVQKLHNFAEFLIAYEPMLNESSYLQYLREVLRFVKLNRPSALIVLVMLTENKVSLFHATAERNKHREEFLTVLRSKVKGVHHNVLKRKIEDIIRELECYQGAGSVQKTGVSQMVENKGLGVQILEVVSQVTGNPGLSVNKSENVIQATGNPGSSVQKPEVVSQVTGNPGLSLQKSEVVSQVTGNVGLSVQKPEVVSRIPAEASTAGLQESIALESILDPFAGPKPQPKKSLHPDDRPKAILFFQDYFLFEKLTSNPEKFRKILLILCQHNTEELDSYNSKSNFALAIVRLGYLQIDQNSKDFSAFAAIFYDLYSSLVTSKKDQIVMLKLLKALKIFEQQGGHFGTESSLNETKTDRLSKAIGRHVRSFQVATPGVDLKPKLSAFFTKFIEKLQENLKNFPLYFPMNLNACNLVCELYRQNISSSRFVVNFLMVLVGKASFHFTMKIIEDVGAMLEIHENEKMKEIYVKMAAVIPPNSPLLLELNKQRQSRWSEVKNFTPVFLKFHENPEEFFGFVQNLWKNFMQMPQKISMIAVVVEELWEHLDESFMSLISQFMELRRATFEKIPAEMYTNEVRQRLKGSILLTFEFADMGIVSQEDYKEWIKESMLGKLEVNERIEVKSKIF